MKTVIFLALMICNLMAISAEEAAWALDAQNDFAKALQKAKTENKMLLLVVVKDDCTWCEKMVHETLKDKNIQDSLSNMVTAVVDVHGKLPSDFKVRKTPTVFFIDAKSEKSVYKNIGYVKKGAFLIDIISANEMMDP
jgi:thioredoxin-related protein